MKTASILFGRAGSKGLPGKNTMILAGRPMSDYALQACAKAPEIQTLYVSTDDPEIFALGDRYHAIRIERPPALCTDSALIEDAMRHGFDFIIEHDPDVDCLVITQSNAPCIQPGFISRAIAKLEAEPEIDSVISVQRLDSFNPARARTLDSAGLMVPYVPLDQLKGSKVSARNAPLPTYFYDSAITVARIDCLRDMSNNLPPFRWMGKKIAYLEQPPGPGDIDYPWQIPIAERWLSQQFF